jgi:Domain of unknown function (DUF4157)
MEKATQHSALQPKPAQQGSKSFMPGNGQNTSAFIQCQLTVTAPNDPYEREADAMADMVMRMPLQNTFIPPAVNHFSSLTINRRCAACEEKEQLMRQPFFPAITPLVQRSSENGSTMVSPQVENGIHQSRGSGHSLDKGTQSFMENGFGTDFSNVKIHTGHTAVQLSRELNAQAFTVGNDIYFNAGKYSPHSADGKHLLAHELTHVVQQGAHAGRKIQRQVLPPIITEFDDAPAVDAGTPPPPAIDPRAPVPIEIENPYATAAEIAESRRLAPALIQSLREADERHDAALLLSRVRALSVSEAVLLISTADFIHFVQHELPGASGWIIYSIIIQRARVDNFPPELVRQLTDALAAVNAANTHRLLRVILPILENNIWFDIQVLRAAVHRVFNGHAQHDALLETIDGFIRDHHRLRITRITDSNSEVHYEEQANGTTQLQLFSNLIAYDLHRSDNALTVIVRIKLVDSVHPDQPYYVSDERRQRWVNGIERTWNNHFVLTNGATRLALVFAPAFMYSSERPHHTVHIGHGTITPICNYLRRENEHCWYDSTTADTAAHEFGHMIGNRDEYNLPGSVSDIPASLRSQLSQDDLAHTTASAVPDAVPMPGSYGLTSPAIMGNQTTGALPRHVESVRNHFNNSILLLPGEATFDVTTT